MSHEQNSMRGAEAVTAPLLARRERLLGRELVRGSEPSVAARRSSTQLDAARRCSTLLDAARRSSTLLDAARRSSTLLDAARRCSTQLDAKKHPAGTFSMRHLIFGDCLRLAEAGAMARMKEEMAAQLAAAKAAARHFFDAPFDLWRLPATGRSWRDGAHEGSMRHLIQLTSSEQRGGASQVRSK